MATCTPIIIRKAFPNMKITELEVGNALIFYPRPITP